VLAHERAALDVVALPPAVDDGVEAVEQQAVVLVLGIQLAVCVAALRRGLDDIVKASLTGSILGNSLLVLGFALFAGGLRRERQRFDRSAASMGSTLLALAAIGLVVPALFNVVASNAVARSALTATQEALRERDLSLEIAVVLFLAYLLSLVFSLGTMLTVGRRRRQS
jgi:Ca2+:H+ antiporter